MGKPKHAIPSIQLNVALPQPVYVQLSTHLYSELENRVPYGAYSKFCAELITSYFRQQQLDLSPYVGMLANTGLSVSGSPESIEILKSTLESA
jgi:hypothetical protein